MHIMTNYSDKHTSVFCCDRCRCSSTSVRNVFCFVFIDLLMVLSLKNGISVLSAIVNYIRVLKIIKKGMMLMKNHKVLFLYGKLGLKSKAVLYCSLHKCFLNKQQLFGKNFKCEKCKYSKNVEEG